MKDTRPPPYPLRMPPDLRELVEESAKANGRSMNAEIVHRLEASLKLSELAKEIRGRLPPDRNDTAPLEARFETLEAAVKDNLTATQRLIRKLKDGTAGKFTPDDFE